MHLLDINYDGRDLIIIAIYYVILTVIAKQLDAQLSVNGFNYSWYTVGKIMNDAT